MQKDQIIRAFSLVFQTPPTGTYFSPGRVNLIGEHIDYHGGLVMPAALTIGTYGAYTKRDDDVVQIYSEGYSTTPLSFSLSDLEKSKTNSWVNYAKGVFKILINAGYPVTSGINLYIVSTMPTSGGLSSSSSLELLIIKILNDIFNLNISLTDMALFGKKVENEYIGVLTGIMDQFVISHGKKDHALLLNTHTLTFDYIPLQLQDYALVIANTNKKRGLADSKYNERYSETMAALKLIQTVIPVQTLTDLNESHLPQIEALLDATTFRRVRHIITEQQRTIKSASSLKSGDIRTFAHYLNLSHASLRDDYEVTGFELDTLVDLFIQYGAIGARMTGAGFGGCAICIIKKDLLENFETNVKEAYTKNVGYEPTFFTSELADGTNII